MAPLPPPPRPPPELTFDIIGEILLRIPPDNPAHLLSASLVCKPWCGLLTDPAFLRRYRAFHRTPPLLGFFSSACPDISYAYPDISKDLEFVPTSTFHPRSSKHRNCCMLDCRHGRALLFDCTTRRLLVWDPITGEDHHIPGHIGTGLYNYNAAVVCAAADCDHLACHGGPFLIVFVANLLPVDQYDDVETKARVYSSESGKWSSPMDVDGHPCIVAQRPPVLIGETINFVCEYGEILRYHLRGDQGFSVIPGPRFLISGPIVLIPAEDGDLRIAFVQDSNIVLWSLKTREPDGVASWKQCSIIKLMNTITDSMGRISPHLIGFVNGPIGDVLFMRTGSDVFAVKLDLRRIEKVDDIDFGDRGDTIFPYKSFVTPECAVGRLELPLQ